MQKESVSKQGRKFAKSTPTAHTDQIFDDVDVNDAMDYMETDAYMQKGVSTEDQVSTVKPDEDRPRATSTRSVLTLKPLPKIDPKDKGKKVLEEEAESDVELEGVDEAERKFDQLTKDEEIARKVEESKEHVGGKKHADLKNKNFEEIQVLYKEVKRSDKNFIAIGSVEDERQINETNEESKDPKKKRLKKRVANETPREEDTAKVPAEQEVTEQGTCHNQTTPPDGPRRTRPC
ncbi:hypothetical protein Tco_1282101 [Tanacetum coccineum]